MGRFYSLSRDGDSGTEVFGYLQQEWDVSIRCREMGTAEQDNDNDARHRHHQVSIRCREMGTAEPTVTVIMYVDGVQVEFLFAVARWGQRNHTAGTTKPSTTSRFYSLSRDGDSGTAPTGQRQRAGSTRFYSLSRDGDSGTLPPLTSF